MSEMTPQQRFFGPARWAQWLTIIGLVLAFLIYFKSVLITFMIALIFWFIIREIGLLVERIKIGGRHLPQWVGGLLALIAILAILFGIGEIIVLNANQIAAKAPEYRTSLNTLILQVGDVVGEEDVASEVEKRISAVDLEKLAGSIFNSFTGFLGSTFLMIIYCTFILIEERVFKKKLAAIFSDSEDQEDILNIIERILHSTRQYITVKTGASIFTGVLSYVVFLLFGVDFPVLWAFLIFLFNYIPYIGSLIATLLPTFLALFQFGSIWIAFWIFVCVEAIQFFVGSYLEPKITGNTLNLSPLVVMLALTFWGFVWGVLGMVISVPITAMLVIILAQFPNTRAIAIMLSQNGDISGLIED